MNMDWIPRVPLSGLFNSSTAPLIRIGGLCKVEIQLPVATAARVYEVAVENDASIS